MTTIELKWFHFRQNNSGGYFKAPAVEVFIEAVDEAGAQARANFIGMSNAGSCSCCGDRWNGCDDEALPVVFELGYGGSFGRDTAIPEAMKFAHGDDTGVVMPVRKQTREEYDAQRAQWRREMDERRAAIARAEAAQ